MAQVIRGNITDAATGARIAVADVRLLNRTGSVIAKAIADTAGDFVLPAPFGDSVRIQVERIGYTLVTSPAYALKRGELLDVDVHMSSEAVVLDPVKVVARKPTDARLRQFYDRAEQNRKLGRGRIWMREDLEHAPPTLLSNLYDMVPRLSMVGCRGSTIYVDNLPVAREELDMMVQPDDVEGVEIYRDMDVPTEYGSGQCLVMLIWRKPYGEGGKPMTKGRILMAAGLAAGLLLVNVIF